MTKDGGPEFPLPMAALDAGMSLRDYFAAQAPDEIPTAWAIRWCEQHNAREFALDADSALGLECAWRYAYADAMLKARERNPS